MLAGIAVLALPACRRISGPEAAPASGMPDFAPHNGTNALALVAEFIDVAPSRPSGSAGAARASKWIADRLKAAGLRPVADVWAEKFTVNAAVADHDFANPDTSVSLGDRESMRVFSNIYADIPGETNTIVMIASHYDTKAGISDDFVGANDGGSSTGLLLELARVLKASGYRPRHTIRFAFFDGEECIVSYKPEYQVPVRDSRTGELVGYMPEPHAYYDGLHGSCRMLKHFLQPEAPPLAAVIVADMVGDADLTLEIPRNCAPWLASLALTVAPEAGYKTLCLAKEGVTDDHWPFAFAEFAAIDLIDFKYGSAPGRNDYWHTPEDTLDKLSADSLATVGRIILLMLDRIERRIGVPEEIL